MAQLVKNLPAVQETWVRSLGREDPRRGEQLPTPYSGLENSMDGIVYGVADKSDTTERLSLSLHPVAECLWGSCVTLPEMIVRFSCHIRRGEPYGTPPAAPL